VGSAPNTTRCHIDLARIAPALVDLLAGQVQVYFANTVASIEYTYVIAVNPSVPATTVPEFIAYAKRQVWTIGVISAA
jgi:hypothetical protein